MTQADDRPLAGWVLQAAERAPSVERSRRRSAERAQQIVRAARRLVEENQEFTTQDLVKAAGLAVQTLYKYFPSKDHILLAVMEDLVVDEVARLEREAAKLDDPVARLRMYVHGILGRLARHERDPRGAHFIITQHWRLLREHPEDMRRVTGPSEEFIERQLREAAARGVLRPNDPAADAWLANQLLLAVYHNLACQPAPDIEATTASTWAFCMAAWGGSPEQAPLPAVRRRRARTA